MATPGAIRKVALHVSPHPDDELLGAGATLCLLVRAGWRVVNLAAGTGRPEHRARRLRELVAATDRAKFDLRVIDPPIAMSGGDDLNSAETLVADQVAQCLAELSPDVVISPHEHDLHHAHELVGRAVRRALEDVDPSPRWWAWGFWADLRAPTLFVPYGEDVLASVRNALAAYQGELDRNDYDRLLPARGIALSVLGSERVFGFGAPAASDLPYADVLLERHHGPDGWITGERRILD